MATCRIKGCRGQVKPDDRPGLGGLCPAHIDSQLDREHRTGLLQQTIRRSLRPANQKTFDLWQIGPTRPEWSTEALTLVEALIGESGPRFSTLKKNKVDLEPEERDQAMKAGAVWHFSHLKKPSCAIWKSVVNGKTWYTCNTHRAYQARPTLKGAIKAFKWVETTS